MQQVHVVGRLKSAQRLSNVQSASRADTLLRAVHCGKVSGTVVAGHVGRADAEAAEAVTGVCQR